MKNYLQLLYTLVALSVVSAGCENPNYSQAKRDIIENKPNQSLPLDGKAIGLVCNFKVTEETSVNEEQVGETKTEEEEEKYIVNINDNKISSVNQFGEPSIMKNSPGYTISLEPNYIKITYKEENDFDGVLNTTYKSTTHISRKTLEYKESSFHYSISGLSTPFTRYVKSEGSGKCQIVNPNTFQKVRNKF